MHADTFDPAHPKYSISVQKACLCVDSEWPGLCNGDDCDKPCIRDCGWCGGDLWVWRSVDDESVIAVDQVLAIVRTCTPTHFTREYQPTDQLRDEICAAIKAAVGP